MFALKVCILIFNLNQLSANEAKLVSDIETNNPISVYQSEIVSNFHTIQFPCLKVDNFQVRILSSDKFSIALFYNSANDFIRKFNTASINFHRSFQRNAITTFLSIRVLRI